MGMNAAVTVVSFYILLIGLACSSSTQDERDAMGLVLSDRVMPPPGLGLNGPVYETQDEQDPLAKADALDMRLPYADLYGLTEPPDGPVRLLAEWAPRDAVLLAWHDDFDAYFLNLSEAILPAAPIWVITQDLANTEKVSALMISRGLDVERVRFFEYTHEAFWARDFGPWTIARDDGLAFIDPRYYPTRYLDDAIPTLLSAVYDVPVFRPKFDAEGGNMMTNGAGLCVTTTRLTYNNPPLFSFELDAVLQTWLGCERTVYLEPLDDERTGHVDLFAKFTQPDVILVGQYPVDDTSENSARLERNAEKLASLALRDGRPLRVVRIPMPPGGDKVHPSYTNALLTNGSAIVPIYPAFPELDADALNAFEEALPAGYNIRVVDATRVIQWGGAVHCTTMQLGFGPVRSEPPDEDRPSMRLWPEDAWGDHTQREIEYQVTLSSTVEVQQTTGAERVHSVEIGLELEHRHPGDLSISLRHDGQTVVVFEGDGRYDATLPKTILVQDFEGSHRHGTWTLNIENGSRSFRAALVNWWIRFSEENASNMDEMPIGAENE